MYYTAKCECSFLACVIGDHGCGTDTRMIAAKKEDIPEEALKEFKTIVDQEEEKGDWCVPILPPNTFC